MANISVNGTVPLSRADEVSAVSLWFLSFRVKWKKLRCESRVMLIEIAFVCYPRPRDSFYSLGR